MNTQQREQFVPEKSIPIDIEHTLEQLSGTFQSVRDGLPELLKNSKDHYARLQITEKKDKQIIVMVSPDSTKLGVLDFGGATCEDLERWQVWSSRDANKGSQSSDIEGGHGNGGKAFMVRGCLQKATICGYSDGKRNKRGFVNSSRDEKYRPGRFYEDDKVDPDKALNDELFPFQITLEDLPDEAKETFKKRKSFTMVVLHGVVDWEKVRNPLTKRRLVSRVPIDLMEHGQAALTIETCTVRVICGKAEMNTGPLTVSELEPMQGLENLLPIPIPEDLVDPITGEKVSTGLASSTKVLSLKSTKNNLRLGGERTKARNIIRVKSQRNVVTHWDLAELFPVGTSAFIYGEIRCPALSREDSAGAERKLLTDTPLARALKHWTVEQVKSLAEEIQRIQASKYSEQEYEKASKALKELRDLMRQFLNSEVAGGVGRTGSDGSPQPPKAEFGERIDEIVLENGTSSIMIANGTAIPLIVKCYEIRNGVRLPIQKPFSRITPLVSEVGIIQNVEGTQCTIKGVKIGKTVLRWETKDRKVQSNPVEVTIMDIASLDITPPSRPLKQGEKCTLSISSLDKSGTKIEGLYYEAYVDESDMGKVSRSGIFTAGGVAGKVTVRFRYGSEDGHVTSASIDIGNERVERSGGSDGSGIPYILLCGTSAPGKEDLPETERTHAGGEEHPTIIDYEPQWESIVWINHSSNESKKVRTGKGTGPGLMGIDTITFQQFVALKCFEILKRLKVREDTGDQQKSSADFFLALSQAEMSTSGFLEAAYDLVRKIIKGDSNGE